MKKAAIILIAFVALVALSSCEPAVTMTAAVSDPTPACGGHTSIYGNVADNDSTTSKVRLQLRAGGEWEDWMWPSPVATTVSGDGAYSVGFQVPWWTQNTLAIRMVSQDNRQASNTTYVTPTEIGGTCD